MQRTELASILLELLEDETGETYSDLDESADLRKGLNLDSLDMVSLILHIENRLKIEINTEELNRAATVGDLLDLLERNLAQKGEQKAA
ncbi:MAG: acyl carrier protein [Thermoguttaceae bacterium]|jgi:acyl carrier protein|nr:acyl carrier protein [Thermoguttaceae bacterium]